MRWLSPFALAAATGLAGSASCATLNPLVNECGNHVLDHGEDCDEGDGRDSSVPQYSEQPSVAPFADRGLGSRKISCASCKYTCNATTQCPSREWSCRSGVCERLAPNGAYTLTEITSVDGSRFLNSNVATGDFDGDGISELVVQQGGSEYPTTIIYEPLSLSSRSFVKLPHAQAVGVLPAKLGQPSALPQLVLSVAGGGELAFFAPTATRAFQNTPVAQQIAKAEKVSVLSISEGGVASAFAFAQGYEGSGGDSFLYLGGRTATPSVLFTLKSPAPTSESARDIIVLSPQGKEPCPIVALSRGEETHLVRAVQSASGCKWPGAQFAEPIVLPSLKRPGRVIGEAPRVLHAADVDGDGNLDLVTTGLNGSGEPIPMQFAWPFSPQQEWKPIGPLVGFVLETFDVNKDRRADYVLCTGACVRVVGSESDAGTKPEKQIASNLLWVNQGDSYASVLDLGGDVGGLIAIADVNGDGFTDLWVGKAENPSSGVYLGGESGAFRLPLLVEQPSRAAFGGAVAFDVVAGDDVLFFGNQIVASTDGGKISESKWRLQVASGNVDATKVVPYSAAEIGKVQSAAIVSPRLFHGMPTLDAELVVATQDLSSANEKANVSQIYRFTNVGNGIPGTLIFRGVCEGESSVVGGVRGAMGVRATASSDSLGEAFLYQGGQLGGAREVHVSTSEKANYFCSSPEDSKKIGDVVAVHPVLGEGDVHWYVVSKQPNAGAQIYASRPMVNSLSETVVPIDDAQPGEIRASTEIDADCDGRTDLIVLRVSGDVVRTSILRAGGTVGDPRFLEEPVDVRDLGASSALFEGVAGVAAAVVPHECGCVAIAASSGSVVDVVTVCKEGSKWMGNGKTQMPIPSAGRRLPVVNTTWGDFDGDGVLDFAYADAAGVSIYSRRLAGD